MRFEDLVVNTQCVELGIAPMSGIDLEKVSEALKELKAAPRRTMTRKFRKVLKKAIRSYVSSFHAPGTQRYKLMLAESLKMSGFSKGREQKFSYRERNYRKNMVYRYLLQESNN